MNRLYLWLILLLAAGCQSISPSQIPQPQPSTLTAKIAYKVYDLPTSQVHTLLVPANSPYTVSLALAPTLAPISQLATLSPSIAALNGGYFDPNNAKTTSFITQAGKVTADPNKNRRLVNNPTIKSYLPKILNRSEFRQYQCQNQTRYDITPHDAPIPTDCQLQNAIAAGPQLLPTLTAESEGFVKTEKGQIIRDAIGVYQKNARSAIALTPAGDLIWIMAAQTAQGRGLSLPEMADFLRTLGADRAINLDGGSSSSLWYDGTTHLGKRDDQGQMVERPIKSAVILRSQ